MLYHTYDHIPSSLTQLNMYQEHKTSKSIEVDCSSSWEQLST